MSQKRKLINRLYSRPKNFTYDEARTLLKMLGFFEDTKGHSSGSRVAFVNRTQDAAFRLHKPHPGNILKAYQVKELLEFVKNLEVKQ